MRVDFVDVTNHALQRWKERVPENQANLKNITDTIKKSVKIKKNEPIPFRIKRKEGLVYSILNEILFIMANTDIHKYRLITVISDPDNKISSFKSFRKFQANERRELKKYKNDSQRNRAKAKSIHVPSLIAGIADLDAERYGYL